MSHNNKLKIGRQALGRTLCLIGLLFVAFLPAAQALDVSGPITVNTTWTVAQGPYTVIADISIDNNALLTIEPGVTVYMNAGTNLTVNAGSLLARGTTAAPIVITSANDIAGSTPTAGDWGQVRILNGASDAGTLLEYVEIRYGRGLAIQSASPTLNYLNIRNNTGPAISLDLQSSPAGTGNQASGNTINGIVVPAGDILGNVIWGLKGIPYVIEQGIVSVGQSPVITGISPNQIQQGETLTATISGTRLSAAEQIAFDNPGLTGTILPGGTATSFQAQITASTTASLAVVPFEAQVAAGRPRLLSGLTVIQSQGRITALSPSSLYTTQPTVTLTVSGQNFVSASTVLLNGVALTTTYVSSTTLTAPVPTQTAGSKSITVQSPDPINSGGFLISDPVTLLVTVPNLSFSPNSLSLVDDTNGTLTLSMPYLAPSGGLSFTLSSNNTSVATVPASVTILEGTSSVEVPVTAVAPTSASIIASRTGFNSAFASVTVTLPPTIFAPATALVSPGLSPNLALTLNTPAPAGGLVLTLSSSDSAVASVPATFAIAAGQAGASIPITGVAAGTATITMSAPGYVTGTTTVTVDQVTLSVALQGTSTYGNTLSVPELGTALYQAQISRPAPTGGLTFTLSTGDSAYATVTPTTVTVPAGATSVTQTITITGVARGTTTFIASAPGINTSTLSLTVTDRLQLQFNTASLTVGAGLRTYQFETSVCRLLNGSQYSAASALVVTLASNDVTLATVPESVTIPSGSACAFFYVTGVNPTISTVAQVDAVASGYIAPTTKLSVSVVTPTFQIQNLAGTRNTLSTPDDMQVRIFVPGANYPQNQTPAAPLTVNIAVTDATPAGIVQIYNGYSFDSQTNEYNYLNPISQFTLNTNQTSTILYLSNPTGPGSYTITASTNGFTSVTSSLQTALDGANARIEFSQPSIVLGKGFSAYYYDLAVIRTLNGEYLYDAKPVTVTLTSSDPTYVNAGPSTTIQVNSAYAYALPSGIEVTVPSEPPRILASAPGYVTSAGGIVATVVAPTVALDGANGAGLEGTRSTLSASRDYVCTSLTVPGAVFPLDQIPLTPFTVDWSVTNASTQGIVELYDAPAGGSVVTQSIHSGNGSPACVYVGQPTVVGSYTLTAAITGIATYTSPVQAVSGNAARLVFSQPSATIGNGMDSGGAISVSRQAYPGLILDTSQALTVDLVSSDPSRVTVPTSVTMPAGATTANFLLSGIATTAGTVVTIDATASGYDAPITKLAVNVVNPSLSMSENYFDGTRSTVSLRDDFQLQLMVPGADAITGVAAVPIVVDLAATDIGNNLARSATASASSTDMYFVQFSYETSFADGVNDGLRTARFKTQDEQHAWWQADLGTVQAFDRVYVHFDRYAEGGTRIAILTATQPFVDSDFNSETLPTTFSNNATLIYQSGDVESNLVVTLVGTFSGRYIRVVALNTASSLMLNEVELFQGGVGASGIVSFFDVVTGGSPVTQVTIPAGQNTVTAYIGEPTATGSYVITATGSGTNNATSISQVVNLPSLEFQNLYSFPRPNDVLPFEVRVPIAVNSDTTVTLTSSNTAVATLSNPTAVIPAGSNVSATINFSALTEGVTVITVTAPGFHPVKMIITVSLSGPPV